MNVKIISILLLIGLVSCSRVGSSSAPRDTLRIAVLINPNTLNPILATDSIENFIDGLFASELVTRDNHGNEIPDLATRVPTQQNGDISKDGLRITYHLRPNARWQDGKPVTSEDVAFTWRAIMNPNNNVVERTGYDQVKSVITPDAHTITFVLKRPFGPFVQTIFSESDDPFRILPSHLLADMPNINAVAYNSLPIGSGPYRVVRWVRGDHIDLVANPLYYRGAPRIPKIVIRIMPDSATVEAEMRTGNLDLAHEISATSAHDLQGVRGIRIVHAVGPEFTSIAFNIAHTPLKDRRVREAIAFAIDTPSLVQSFYHGFAKPAIADLSPFYWAFDPTIPMREFNPKRASGLLDEAGWKPGQDGIRRKDGKSLTLLFVYGNGATSTQDFVVSIGSMLRKVGIRTELKGYSYSLLYAPIQMHGILNSGAFDLALYPWISGSDPDNSSDFSCNAIPPNGNNIFHLCSSKIDAAEKLAVRSYSIPVRKRAYATIERQLMRDVPADFLVYPLMNYAISQRFHGFASNGSSEGWNAAEWSL